MASTLSALWMLQTTISTAIKMDGVTRSEDVLHIYASSVPAGFEIALVSKPSSVLQKLHVLSEQSFYPSRVEYLCSSQTQGSIGSAAPVPPPL